MAFVRFLLFIPLGLSALSASAQDIHFSQFYASPLTLNPSLTGFHEGSYRLTGIYRNQWRSVTSPYQTFGASFDMRLLQSKLKDVLGAGISILYDKAGDGNLSLMGTMASASFHKALGKDNNHFIGIGIQLGFAQRSLDYNSLSFPEQYVNGSFVLTQPNGENFSGSTVNYFDMNAGLLWTSQFGKRLGVFAGTTFFHLTQPKESFLGDNDYRLHLRELAHAGLNIRANEHFYITPNFLFMHQNKAKEVNLGSAAEYHFKDTHNTILSLGGWYRLDDAPIVSASLEHRSIRIGVAYDVNTSELQPASSHRGAFEISILYIGKISRVEAPLLVPCPRL
ncbi:MAG TPA: PorP/SprF family type IX secretion system membrane protein [Chitinophagales bacterium]|nr:PorP/SprF family type IX secretion system membrane protein [Chitinophagales bacterium]